MQNHLWVTAVSCVILAFVIKNYNSLTALHSCDPSISITWKEESRSKCHFLPPLSRPDLSLNI